MVSGAPSASPRSWLATDARDDAVGRLVWAGAAAGLGFAVAFVGVSILALPRDAFVLLHVGASGLSVLGYWRWARIGARAFVQRWLLGAIVGGGAAVFSVAFVLRAPRAPDLRVKTS